jgi:hypothetical protein
VQSGVPPPHRPCLLGGRPEVVSVGATTSSFVWPYSRGVHKRLFSLSAFACSFSVHATHATATRLILRHLLRAFAGGPRTLTGVGRRCGAT